jgi:membrane fusion protein (multidrug efflux system)
MVMTDMLTEQMRSVRPALVGALLMGSLVLAGCGGGDEAQAAAGGPPGGGMPPMPVDVDTARTGRVTDAVRATGRIEAVNSIELRPDVQGRVTEILFREGQYVERGAPLIKLDDEILRAQAARAEAERDLAKQKLDRATRLRTDNASSPADYEEAAATARAAEANLAALQLQVDRSTIRAPFSGVAGQRFVSIGDYVTSASRLLTLQTTNPQRASIDIPERHASTLRRGQIVEFTVASQPGRTFRATVDFVDPVVREEGRTILVKGSAPNPNGLLRAGMFIEARLNTGTRAGAVVVPEDAILPLRTANIAWVVVDGKAARRTVQLGARTQGVVEILSGVSAGEMVVVGGLERMAEGMAVAPRQRGAQAAAQRAGDQTRP